MAQNFKVKVQKLKIDYKKLNKVLMDDEHFDAYMKEVARKWKKSVEDQIARVNTSHDSERTPKQIQQTKEYFEQLVTSTVIKGKTRKMITLWLNGYNSDAYEAEHGVLEKSMNDLRGKLS